MADEVPTGSIEEATGSPGVLREASADPVSVHTVDCSRYAGVLMLADFGVFLDGKGGRVLPGRMFCEGGVYMLCQHVALSMCALGYAQRINVTPYGKRLREAPGKRSG